MGLQQAVADAVVPHACMHQGKPCMSISYNLASACHHIKPVCVCCITLLSPGIATVLCVATALCSTWLLVTYQVVDCLLHAITSTETYMSNVFTAATVVVLRLPPRFPKLKEEGWWLVIGHTPTRELLALRRVSFGGHTTVHLTFPQHSSTGHALDVVTLYLVSDAYIGLDQQYDIRLDGQIE